MPTLHLPQVFGNLPISGQSDPRMSPLAQEFAVLWLALLGERASIMVLDDRLVACAAAHAEYLAQRTGDELLQSMHRGRGGSYSNQRVLEAGYRLPDYFPVQANQVESCARNSGGATAALEGLLNSDSHRPHLLGEGWFEGHTSYGAGQIGADWVIVICPKEAS